MARVTLTKRVVDALEPRERDYTVFCKDYPGFGVRVRPSGLKTFIAQYDFYGRTRKVTIGPHGPLKTFKEAQDDAIDILRDARKGIDRAAHKAKERAVLTMAALCDEYLKEGCDHKKASTLATDRGRIERHIKPLLGTKRITDIDRATVKRFMKDVADGTKIKADVKTGKHGRAIVTGGKGAATRTVRLLGGIFSYAVERGYLKTNPRHGVKVYGDQKGERFLSGDELARLGDALHEAETVGLPWRASDPTNPKSKHRPNAGEQREKIDLYALAAIRLLMLTGARAGEILSLQWEHVHADLGWLALPDSKTGAKKVYLGAAALEVLNKIPKEAGNPYVIVGSKAGERRSDLKRPWKRITDHAGLPGLRLHDLRHSFASMGAMAGNLAIVGKLLGHASPTTTARYAHFADDPVKGLADATGSRIAASMNRGSGANVVPIKASS